MSKSNRLSREAKALARRENISLSVAKRKIMSGTAPDMHEPVRHLGAVIPRVAIMPVCPVVRSRQQAAEQHGGIELPLGIGPDGPVSFKAPEQVHRLVVGPTGSGGTLTLAADLAHSLATGAQVFATETSDTWAARQARFPNISAVGSTPAEWVIVIHLVWSILQQRRNGTDQDRTPVVLLLDGLDGLMGALQGEYGNTPVAREGHGRVLAELSDLFEYGEQHRVTLSVRSQTPEAWALRNEWIERIQLRRATGKIAPMTLNKLFPESVQQEVGDLIQQAPSRLGVGRTVATWDEGGTPHVTLYQGYYYPSYSEKQLPGFPDGADREQALRVSEALSRVPKLYPRQWVRIDAEDDLSQLSVPELHDLEPILLDDPKTLAPIAEHERHDPLSEQYIGRY